jgi:hypothetical protein
MNIAVSHEWPPWNLESDGIQLGVTEQETTRLGSMKALQPITAFKETAVLQDCLEIFFSTRNVSYVCSAMKKIRYARLIRF